MENKYIKIKIPYLKEYTPYKPEVYIIKKIIDDNILIMKEICDTFNIPAFLPFSFMCYYEMDMYDVPSPMSITARFRDILDKNQLNLLNKTIKEKKIKEYNYITLCLYLIEKINDFNVVDENNNLKIIKLFLSVIYPYSYGKKSILLKYDEFTILNSIKEEDVIENILYFSGRGGLLHIVYNIIKGYN